MFSQVLGINDHGIAVGYYGDSTTSQHGFLYNTNTQQYTFLDAPNAAFDNGVEITQITGINNSGEITGFYSDANGVFHGFVATTVPEPSSVALLGVGLTTVMGMGYVRRLPDEVRSLRMLSGTESRERSIKLDRCPAVRISTAAGSVFARGGLCQTHR